VKNNVSICTCTFVLVYYKNAHYFCTALTFMTIHLIYLAIIHLNTQH